MVILFKKAIHEDLVSNILMMGERAEVPKDEAWIDERVSKAKKAHPTVTDSTATRMTELLKGQISERQLRATELTKIANDLIADMAEPAPPKVEATHAD